MLDWLTEHQHLVAQLSIISAIVFVVSLLSLPWLVSLIPQDYFSHQQRRPAPWKNQHPVVRLVLLVGKNILGVILLLGGLLMLLIPGQGLLTMVVGILLLDYPGKYQLERRLVTTPKVLKSINWLRAKINHPPLITERTQPEADDREL